MSLRVDQWPEILAAEIERARNRPFQWGTHDCALMAADIVLAMTGVDYAAEFRGRYRSALGAARLLKRGGGLWAVLDRQLGASVPAAMAQRGDVVLARFAAGDTAGVCVGGQSAFPGLQGVVFRPTIECLAAWRV